MSFPCDVCNKGFHLKCSLIRHLLIHTREKLFSCSICRVRFSSKFNLNGHSRNHCGEKSLAYVMHAVKDFL